MTTARRLRDLERGAPNVGECICRKQSASGLPSWGVMVATYSPAYGRDDDPDPAPWPTCPYCGRARLRLGVMFADAEYPDAEAGGAVL